MQIILLERIEKLGQMGDLGTTGIIYSSRLGGFSVL